MDLLVPRPLSPGDHVRVVAPATSLAFFDEAAREESTARLVAETGMEVSFSARAEHTGPMDTAPVASRVADLHEAFADPSVDAVLTVLGGYTSNQLLPHLDFELIRANPKTFCGYSDITALSGAMLARAGLVTFSGMHWSTFRMRDHNERTIASFRRTLFADDPVRWTPSPEWTDDEWWLDQDDRHPVPNEGWWVLRTGRAAGRLLGGNLGTLNLLQGTPYLPDLTGGVLAVEDDYGSDAVAFCRHLTSLVQAAVAQGGPEAVRGVVIGRFQRASEVSRDALEAIVGAIDELDAVPVIANVDIGHTSPIETFPFGGWMEVVAETPDPGRAAITVRRAAP